MEEDLTELLVSWSDGDEGAGEELMRRVYHQLHRMAENRMRGERPGHTLQPTALIHEAFLLLVDQRSGWKNRSHFFKIAARCMRRIVLQHARRRAAAKHGGGAPKITLDEASLPATARPVDLLDLDRALDRLKEIEPRQVEVVELRFYGGYTAREIAETLGISESTVNREWALARAWLTCELERPSAGATSVVPSPPPPTDATAKD
jgi:RNA polymerase sigma factor (TIGR02999 family)